MAGVPIVRQTEPTAVDPRRAIQLSLHDWLQAVKTPDHSLTSLDSNYKVGK